MKRTILIIAVTLISCSVQAQLQKGAILMGGSMSYNGINNTQEFSAGYSSGSDYKYTFVALKPKIGFFLSESFLLGVGATFEHLSTEQEIFLNNPIIIEETSNVAFINPYFTKYIQLTDKFYFNTTANLLVGLGKQQYGDNSDREADIFEFRINLTPGLTYFISNRWALTCDVGNIFYNRRQEKLVTTVNSSDDLKNVDSNYGISLDFNAFSLGFQYYLNNKSSE